jgi:uncharacterized membrane protein
MLELMLDSGLGRWELFALLEVSLVVALFVIARWGLEGAIGKTMLLAACLILGVLLALLEKSYQTGSPTWYLYFFWAVLIFPWMCLGRSNVLWMFWLALLNVAGVFYQVAVAPSVVAISPTNLPNDLTIVWTLLCVNTLALVFWEAAALHWKASWQRSRWCIRIVAWICGGLITLLALINIALGSTSYGYNEMMRLAIPVWLLWLGMAYLVYRKWIYDIFILSGIALSIITIATFLFKDVPHQLGAQIELSHWLQGIFFIVISVIMVMWLKRVRNKVRKERGVDK